MRRGVLIYTFTAAMASKHTAAALGDNGEHFLASTLSRATTVSREWSPHDFNLSDESFCHSSTANESKLRACWDPDEILTDADDGDHLGMLRQALDTETLFTTTCLKNQQQHDVVSLQVAVAVVGKVSPPMGSTRLVAL